MKNHYCHCQGNTKSKYNDVMVKSEPKITIVDKEGVCIHCGYYALRSIPERAETASTNKQNHDNAVPQMTLLDRWRMERGDELSS